MNCRRLLMAKRLNNSRLMSVSLMLLSSLHLQHLSTFYASIPAVHSFTHAHSLSLSECVLEEIIYKSLSLSSSPGCLFICCHVLSAVCVGFNPWLGQSRSLTPWNINTLKIWPDLRTLGFCFNESSCFVLLRFDDFDPLNSDCCREDGWEAPVDGFAPTFP